ncbi:MAG: hypothetical protein JWO31_4158, partial [Phycisphaerales bacterium]|nr:hypothetical protein [Phycisphaerales bacterium]
QEGWWKWGLVAVGTGLLVGNGKKKPAVP